jgi:hypothetical protein
VDASAALQPSAGLSDSESAVSPSIFRALSRLGAPPYIVIVGIDVKHIRKPQCDLVRRPVVGVDGLDILDLGLIRRRCVAIDIPRAAPLGHKQNDDIEAR